MASIKQICPSSIQCNLYWYEGKSRRVFLFSGRPHEGFAILQTVVALFWLGDQLPQTICFDVPIPRVKNFQVFVARFREKFWFGSRLWLLTFTKGETCEHAMPTLRHNHPAPRMWLRGPVASTITKLIRVDIFHLLKRLQQLQIQMCEMWRNNIKLHNQKNSSR